MMHFGHFETELQMRYPSDSLFIRNMCDGGNTPGFRPHSSRPSPWAFPGAERFYPNELSNPSGSIGHFPTEDEWLTMLKADVIIAFFGYNESFAGPAGIADFKDELHAFIDHTKQQRYNGTAPARLILVSPIAFENLSEKMDLPDGVVINKNLALYSQAIAETAAMDSIQFVDIFAATKNWYTSGEKGMTQDGFQLTGQGYRKLAPILADAIFGQYGNIDSGNRELVNQAVNEKNWYWHDDFKIPNGVHAYGRRYDPFGPDNYPFEIEKTREMTAVRDTAIWMALQGKIMDLQAADAKTMKLPPIETNYKPDPKDGIPRYLYGDEALSKIKVAPGYHIGMFASEVEFPDLANPVQLSFDNRGRLWVAVMPSYPHYKPGDPKPNDKLLIFEDTDGDQKADKQTVFANGLHLPIGFELAPEGVYVSQGTNLILLTDTDGDDKADKKEIVLSGFDDHDTHHAISAFTADPSGAIYMGEGVFLHTNVETAYGPVRGTNGGFYRYSPQRHHLERTAQLPIPNPWGIAFDEWGQDFFEHTSGPDMTWMMPGTIKPRYGDASPLPENLIEERHRVRPTSGLEIVSSRHFPAHVQGDILINNTIGFLGTKQHRLLDDPRSAGYISSFRQDLVASEDKNFRPVDMEFAPDGSLYLIDWSNVLIGHMQHNARDPLRDHSHGRIYRITYPSRPLVRPANIAGAPIDTLLENLKLPEFRTRYRTRRELRGRTPSEVLPKLGQWTKALNTNDPRYGHHLLEALWVSWGLDQVDVPLLRQLLKSDDFRIRSAAVGVLRYVGDWVEDQPGLLITAAHDPHPRVRLQALVTASWLPSEVAIPIAEEVGKKPLDQWMQKPYEAVIAHLHDRNYRMPEPKAESGMPADAITNLLMNGKEIYFREGFCVTCHQTDGNGLEASGFPPLNRSKWVTGDPDRLIKLTLHGLMGPIEVNGKKYPGQVPMTPFGGMLDDSEIASVLSFVRNSFGNKATMITKEDVGRVREETKDQKGFYSPEALLQDHPIR